MSDSTKSLLASLRQSQLHRIQYLVEWLRRRRTFTRGDAAREFQVTVRTIAEDIRRLKALGVPVAFDSRRNTYFLTESFDGLPLLSIKRTEYAALLVARYALEALGDTPDAEHLEAVADRLASQLTPEVQVAPETLRRVVQIDRSNTPKQPAHLLEPLRSAAEQQLVTRIRYQGNYRGEETERIIEPYRLLSRDGYWYLIAYCRTREDLRSFRIDRIRSLDVTDEVFLHDTAIDLDDYLDETFGIHWDERTYPVRIRFSPYQARWIEEEKWHPTQLMTKRRDGSLELHMKVTGLADVAQWVLSYGGEAEVLSPPVLRHRVAREARRMAAQYTDVGPSVPPRSGNIDKPDNTTQNTTRDSESSL